MHQGGLKSLWLEHKIQGDLWKAMLCKSSQGTAQVDLASLIKDIILKAMECH